MTTRLTFRWCYLTFLVLSFCRNALTNVDLTFNSDSNDVEYMHQQRADGNDVDDRVSAMSDPRHQAGNGVDKFALASYYGNHMVLQSAPRRARVWGYAPRSQVGKSVQITLQSTDQHYSANFSTSIIWSNDADSAIWQIQMTPVQAGGPYSFQAYLANYSSLKIDDLLFGDVWLCSGQSNMQFTVGQMFNATEELANAHLFTKVRIFDVAMITSDKPLYDLPGIIINWSLPSNDTVKPFSAVCWLYGRYTYMLTGRPQGMVETCWGGTPVEAWSSPEALRQCGIKPADTVSVNQSESVPTNGSVLWNSMVHPFLPMTINGALWYQGEANVGAPNTYNCTFPMMISDWRKNFHISSDGQTNPFFPFGFVQLAPSGDDGWTLTEGTTDIRWHQSADVGYVPNIKMPNVFMAVTMDLPDPHSPYSGIHPRDKTTVGQRLSLAGWAVAYGTKNITYQGPFPTVLTSTATYINVTYNMNIQTRQNDGFEVCCDPLGCAMSGKNWTPCVMKTTGKNTVALSLDGCHKHDVTGLRYAWRENPCQYKKCAIYSTVNNLPGPPFIHWMH